jgi:hypothetical protein
MQNITAVKWLVENMQRLNQHESPEEWNKLFEQAKAMEKEQIINAIDSQYNYDSWPKELPTLGEQYYNETYNK